jgi:hypothetical protein
VRKREFEAGRYNPVIRFPDFPIGPESPAPGAQHASIEEALAASAEDGTRSILDLSEVRERPDYCAVAPFEDEALEELFGTTRPTRDVVEEQMFELLEDIDRGQGMYFLLYEGDQPTEIVFMGYSFD